MGIDVGGVATLTSPGATLAVDGASRWMDVNANGILTRPQTPYMRGQISGQASTYNAGGGPLLVVPDVNRGNCWNSAHGIWTCPIAGYYMMTWGAIAGPVSSGYPALARNGGNYHYTHWSHVGNWHFISLSSVIQCATGDTLNFYIFSYNPATAGVHGNGNHAMYSIALLV
jgi:hypothetical protein